MGATPQNNGRDAAKCASSRRGQDFDAGANVTRTTHAQTAWSSGDRQAIVRMKTCVKIKL